MNERRVHKKKRIVLPLCTAIVGLGHEPDQRADLGRVGLQDDFVADLVVQERAILLQRQRQAPGSRSW